MLEHGTVSEVGHILEANLDMPPPGAGPSAMALMGHPLPGSKSGFFLG